jgi:cytochrome c oxidase accessory protein FixG
MNEPHRRIPIAVAPAPVSARSPEPGSVPADGAADDDAHRGGLLSAYVAHTKVYPRSVDGRYARLRVAALIITQLVFYGLPWLQWNDRQAVLFDLGARKFYLFGIVLWPQDFVYLAGLLIIAALTLFFITAVAGRVWCGYACPQTVYSELFMRIEQWIEGDRNQRMKLDAGPWTRDKLLKKGAKHAVWIALALWTGFTFIGYFAPIRELGPQIASLSLGPWQWFWWLFYSFATWGNAGFMREQVCTYMCPYARFQGAMFDNDTMIITYDAARGDPRGSRSRKADPAKLGLGDCIDCTLCVHVCPTGIDIRNGLQYQCIGCAACIDVCNGVMDKMQYPRGLIRYTTGNALRAGLSARDTMRRVLRPRTLIYATLLIGATVALVASLALRSPLRVDVIRDRNALARLTSEGAIENTYRLQLMNASETPLKVRVSVAGIDGLAASGPTEFSVPAAANRMVPVSLTLNPDENPLAAGTHPIRLRVEAFADDPARPTPASSVARLEERAVFTMPR